MMNSKLKAMDISRMKILFILFLCFVFIFYTIRAYLMLDPDFGWHIREGELIAGLGIPRQDPFSYTMPSFPFIDHEWFTNLILYKGFQTTGYGGLSVIFAVFALIAVFVSYKLVGETGGNRVKSWSLALVPVTLSLGTLYSFFGIRPQVLSWLFLEIFLFVLNKRSKFRLLLLIILTFIWVNLHGSFAIAIVAVLIKTILDFFKDKKIFLEDLLTSSLLTVSSFLNPYGIRVWHEVFQQAADTKVRWYISEWLPSFLVPDLFMWILIVMSIMFIARYWRKFTSFELVLNAFFLTQGLLSVRHIPLWVLVNLPMFVKSFVYFYDEASRIPGGRMRFNQLFKPFAVFFMGFFFLKSLYQISFFSEIITEKYGYPRDAINFVKSLNPQGQIFSEYSWGGYLIWKMPEKKVFIDGRMATWKWNAGKKEETDYVMGDYIGIVDGSLRYSDFFDKYHVEVVIWPTERPKTFYEVLEQKFQTPLRYFHRLIGVKIPDKSFGKVLEETGWDVLYKDDIATVYERI